MVDVYGHTMKTTIETPDPLLDQVRDLAKRRRSSVKALMEQGLRRVLAEQQQLEPFRLRRASFKGNGLRPELQDAAWAQLRELAYQDHGA